MLSGGREASLYIVSGSFDKLAQPSSAEAFADLRVFRSFFAHLNSYGGFLDVDLHGDVDFVRARSSLLLTAILMIAARHDPSPPSSGIAERADAHISTVCWPAVLLENYRSVQALQACMLLATWRTSGSRGDEDSGWSFFGHALRMAVEIGLQRPLRRLHDDANATGEHLVRDAQRSWLTLALADASWSAQTGRPPLLSLEDQPPEWLRSQITTPEDRSIVALIEYRILLKELRSRSVDALELPANELVDWREKWCRPGNGGESSVSMEALNERADPSHSRSPNVRARWHLRWLWPTPPAWRATLGRS